MANLAQLRWCLGYPDEALKVSREAVDSAQQLSHLHSLTYSMYFAIRLRLLRRETQEADELAEKALELSTKHEFGFLRAMIVFLQGWSLLLQGQGIEGLGRMRTGLADTPTGGTEGPVCNTVLAEGLGQLGELDEARRLLAHALDAVKKTGQRYHEAEMYRLQGELHLREANPALKQAETSFHRALELARHQQAKSWELRAAMSLARLWATQGRRGEAHDLLAPVYGWFTEGFDTADLKDAKALLDELR
jgi:predicted ATPase